MIIEKVLNNNLVMARNQEGKEVILKGRAVGYNKKKGDPADCKLVERVFVPSDKQEMLRFQEFFATLPQEYWETAEQILEYASGECGLKVSEKVLLPLSDHIAGAVERYRGGIVLKNPMLWDIRHLYPLEFAAGKEALKIIERRFAVHMEEDEAAFLAFHFVYAQLGDGSGGDLSQITQLIKDITDIVEECFQVRLDENSWDYQRFITHLKFFAQRLFEGRTCEESEDSWYGLIRRQYPRAYQCIVKIADFIHDRYYYELNREEMLYLMIHIEKVTRKRPGGSDKNRYSGL